ASSERCQLHSHLTPSDEMLMQQIGRGLLHELELEVAELTSSVPEGGHPLMRVILRIRHEHQRESRTRPGPVLVRVAPDAAELRDDRPVALSLSLTRTTRRDHLSALQRNQDI